MEKHVILKKLFNENVLHIHTSKHAWLRVPLGVNTRWIFEMANELSKHMKVHLKIG